MAMSTRETKWEPDPTLIDKKLPTLLDNRGENRVNIAFQLLLPQSRNRDVAKGYFAIGALLVLDDHWQHLESMRILLGD